MMAKRICPSRATTLVGVPVVVLALLAAAAVATTTAACGGSSANAAGAAKAALPSSSVAGVGATALIAAPAPIHRYASREIEAMDLAQAAVDANLWGYDTSRYRGLTADIIGYVVEWERPGLGLVATVDTASGRTVMWAISRPFAFTSGSTYGVTDSSDGAPAWTKWAPLARSSGGESRALTAAGEAMHKWRRTGAPWLPSGDPLLIAYIVGWPRRFVMQRESGLTILVPADLKHGVFPPILGPDKW
jgi:hypothetical protein